MVPRHRDQKDSSMRHLLTWASYSTQEIQSILEVARDLKAKLKLGERSTVLKQQVIGLLFQKPSLRTRVSFESLATQIGASSLFLGDDVGWGKREPAEDFFPVLTSYLDCLVIRARSHDDLEQAAGLSSCPVINGLTDYSHPCQALADLMTIEELFGHLNGIKIAYIGDSNNVAFSLALLAGKLGLQFRIASPATYQFTDPQRRELARTFEESGAEKNLVTTTDPVAAVSEADIVYTDVWTSMGQESERQQRLQHFAKYQVNSELMSHANKSVRFLHCLPARRGEEVSAEIIDGPTSATVHQAENRLHAQKGLLVWLMNQNRIAK